MHQITGCLKQGSRIRGLERCLCVQSRVLCASEGSPIDQCPRVVGGAVGSVGAGAKEATALVTRKLHGRGQGQVLIAAAPSRLRRQAYRGFPSLDVNAGGAGGQLASQILSPLGGIARHEPPMNLYR